MTTQSAASNFDTRHAITGWLARTVLFVPFIGAIVFAASTHVISGIHPVLAMAAGLLTAGAVHAVKSIAVRPVVTATTAGAGNVPVSIMEDAVATFLSVMAVVLPILAAAIVIFILVLISWWLWRKAPTKGIP